MALTRTTLAGGVSVYDTEVLLASTNGVTVNSTIQIDQEALRVLSVGGAGLPSTVYRGARGTLAVAHPMGAGVVVGVPGDFIISGKATLPKREILSFSVSGSIGPPTPGLDRVAVLNGTAVLNMTVGPPGLDNDGDLLIIVGAGKAAHVVTVSGGVGAGGATLDALTFAAGAQNSVVLVAANGSWAPFGSVLGGAGVTGVTVTAA